MTRPTTRPMPPSGPARLRTARPIRADWPPRPTASTPRRPTLTLTRPTSTPRHSRPPPSRSPGGSRARPPMATPDPAVLDDFLNKFKTQVDAGFGLNQGDVSGVLATLVTISIVITAVLWAIYQTQNVLASLVRKVLLVGFFAWLVAQWHTLSTTVVNGFAALGLKAGGGAMSVSTFTS